MRERMRARRGARRRSRRRARRKSRRRGRRRGREEKKGPQRGPRFSYILKGKKHPCVSLSLALPSDLVCAPGLMIHLFSSCFGINCSPTLWMLITADTTTPFSTFTTKAGVRKQSERTKCPHPSLLDS